MRPMEHVSYNEIRNTHSKTSDGNVNAGTIAVNPSADSFLGLLRARTGVQWGQTLHATRLDAERPP